MLILIRGWHVERNLWNSDQVARIVRHLLEAGQKVEIGGLGRFQPVDNGFEFIAATRPKVFLAYVDEDRPKVARLFEDLAIQGYDPWLDRRSLLPGQNWQRTIEEAIEASDFFVACFSRQSVRKKSAFQAEIRYALECARRLPLDETFLIPVRLDDCTVPSRIQRETHYIDLFPAWGRGLRRILSIIGKPRGGKQRAGKQRQSTSRRVA